MDKVDRYWLSWNPTLPLEFFEKHLDIVDWETLSENPMLPERYFKY